MLPTGGLMCSGLEVVTSSSITVYFVGFSKTIKDKSNSIHGWIIVGKSRPVCRLQVLICMWLDSRGGIVLLCSVSVDYLSPIKCVNSATTWKPGGSCWVQSVLSLKPSGYIFRVSVWVFQSLVLFYFFIAEPKK